MLVTTLLGELDTDYLCTIPVMEKTRIPDRDANWDLHGKPPPCFGLILPSSIDLREPGNTFEGIQKRFYDRFDKVEQACEEIFEVPGDSRFSLKYQQDKDEDVRDWQVSFALTPREMR